MLCLICGSGLVLVHSENPRKRIWGKESSGYTVVSWVLIAVQWRHSALPLRLNKNSTVIFSLRHCMTIGLHRGSKTIPQGIKGEGLWLWRSVNFSDELTHIAEKKHKIKESVAGIQIKPTTMLVSLTYVFYGDGTVNQLRNMTIFERHTYRRITRKRYIIKWIAN